MADEVLDEVDLCYDSMEVAFAIHTIFQTNKSLTDQNYSFYCKIVKAVYYTYKIQNQNFSFQPK